LKLSASVLPKSPQVAPRTLIANFIKYRDSTSLIVPPFRLLRVGFYGKTEELSFSPTAIATLSDTSRTSSRAGNSEAADFSLLATTSLNARALRRTWNW